MIDMTHIETVYVSFFSDGMAHVRLSEGGITACDKDIASVRCPVAKDELCEVCGAILMSWIKNRRDRREIRRTS